MVSSYSQSVQNTAKCPHGFPVGSCPICSGMGGGSTKNRDKPRRAGEMSYNECLAEWHKIQAQKEAKNQAKAEAQLNKAELLNKLSLQSKILNGLVKLEKVFSEVSQNIEKLPALIKAPLKFIINNIAKPVINFVLNTLAQATKNIQMFFNNASNFINSVTEKLASVFGEIKNFADNFFADNKIKKTLKTMLSLFTEEEDEEESEEAQKIKARELKKVLKSLFKIKRKEPKKDKNGRSSLT